MARDGACHVFFFGRRPNGLRLLFIVRIRGRLVPASEPLGSSLRKSGEGALANGPEVQGDYANDLRDDALEGIGI